MSILDHSKHLMYDFWCNNITSKYGEKVNLLYTDTDSLIMQVDTPDIYADMSVGKDSYDLSDFPKDHQYHGNTNKKVIGRFNDECCSVPINEFIALMPKMYSIELSDLRNIWKAKGEVKSIVKKDLRHALYTRSLQEDKQFTHTLVLIRSNEHQIGVFEQNKINLSPLDTKSIYYLME